MNQSFEEQVIYLKNETESFVAIILVETKGSAPQDVGAKAIITNQGLNWGTIGGGKIENHCILFARELLEDKNLNTFNFLKSWNLQKDIGMTCGGVVSMYFEVYRPEKIWHIAVFGAGHVSQQLCRTLIRLNCRLTCIDQRQEWLDKLPKEKKLTAHYLENPVDILAKLNPETFLIFMTQGHSTDLPILESALKNFNFPYLAAIGSPAKANRMKQELRANGVGLDRTEKFICPIGDNIGDNSPVEIAFSITAQLLRKRDLYFKTTKRSSE